MVVVIMAGVRLTVKLLLLWLALLLMIYGGPYSSPLHGGQLTCCSAH